MERHVKNLLINLGVLVFGISAAFSGLLIQVKYHMGNHGDIDTRDMVFGLGYSGWSDIHKIAIVILSLFMFFHISLHWKWYKAVIKKRLVNKHIQVFTLSVVFILVAITGLVPWFIGLMRGYDNLRKAFMEIHDKLTLILLVYLILHVIKRLKWFVQTFEKVVNQRSIQDDQN